MELKTEQQGGEEKKESEDMVRKKKIIKKGLFFDEIGSGVFKSYTFPDPPKGFKPDFKFLGGSIKPRKRKKI